MQPTDNEVSRWYCPGCGFNPEKYDPDGDTCCPKCGIEMRPPEEIYDD